MSVPPAARRTLPLLIAVTLLTGCEGVQSSLDPVGYGAEMVSGLWWFMLLTASVLWLILMGFVAAAVLRAPRPTREGGSPYAPRSTAFALAGSGITLAVLLAVLLLSLRVDRETRRFAGQERLAVEVTGHQFWWEVRYAHPETGNTIVSANELHLPAGEPVRIDVRAADVIHSFWIPNIHGKIDMLPGRTNTIWVRAEEPGVYRGQCAEFCGLQHANMAFMVVVHEPREFDDWLDRERRPARPPRDSMAARGLAVFRSTACAACHRIRGTGTTGTLGPDLTHLASRRTLAAGTLPNTTGNLGGWLSNPQQIKPGNKMPFVPMDGADLRALLHYLEGLQ